MKQLGMMAACALAALALLRPAAARPAGAQASVEGQITAIAAPTLTTPPQVTINDVTVNVVPGTLIQVANHHAGLADLHVGDEAEAKYDPNTLNASRIETQAGGHAANLAVVGTVLSTGTDGASEQPTVSLDLNRDGVADLTLIVADSTRIQLGDATVSPSQLGLLVGLGVRAEYDGTTFVAKEIQAGPSSAGTRVVAGSVTAVDTTANTLTLQTAAGALTLQVPAGITIQLGGTALTLADLQVGETVRVAFVRNGSGQNVAARIELSPRRLSFEGTLAAVGTDSITVSTRGDQQLTVVVPSDTDLRINGKSATLAQLAAALSSAQGAGRSVKVSGQYLSRGAQNVAVQVRVTARGR